MAKAKGVKIISATYGNKDVKDIVNNQIKNETLFIKASNSLFGDPNLGVVKHLNLTVDIDGVVKDYSIREGGMLKLPESNVDRLGIFYSNNHDKTIYPCIKKSLETIERAALGKADIHTNMWQREPDNPFTETIAWTRTSSHLNQVLQILQLLYTAEAIKDYKYVSFLEHDVLYPEGYFEYPDFEDGCVSNMNYIGLNKSGFQKKTANHQPLSQVTMLFEYAIKHFESILPNAVLNNSGLLEPQVKIKKWDCVNPAVHVNHGKHFTSHYSIYSKETSPENEYWKSYERYLNLFF
jgi:hypothetical protein